MKYPIFCYAKYDDTFWFRIFGYGLHFTTAPMMYSERNGIEKRIRIWKNWRMKGLKR